MKLNSSNEITQRIRKHGWQVPAVIALAVFFRWVGLDAAFRVSIGILFGYYPYFFLFKKD